MDNDEQIKESEDIFLLLFVLFLFLPLIHFILSSSKKKKNINISKCLLVNASN